MSESNVLTFKPWHDKKDNFKTWLFFGRVEDTKKTRHFEIKWPLCSFTNSPICKFSFLNKLENIYLEFSNRDFVQANFHLHAKYVLLLEKSLMHRSILFLINNFYFRICYVNVQWARCGWFIEHHERCSSLQKEQKCRYSTFGFTNLPQTAWWVVPNLKYRLNFLVKS